MFRQWEFDVSKVLKGGENTISITFASARLYTRERDQKRRLSTPKCAPHEEGGRPYLRKEQCNFGWDWGPVLVTAGIWLPIRIVAHDVARLDDVKVDQKHENGGVSLGVSIAAQLLRDGVACTAEASVRLDGAEVASASTTLEGGTGNVELAIDSPKLWWPAGHGEQPLYDVAVVLKDGEGVELDSWRRRVGLRTLELVREKDQWGESFTFACNGRSFFAKGADWIPADAIKGRLDPEMIRDLLQSARDGNMNMLRVWGGGLYEPDHFYDICDELGLCVWQDFMYACSAYPTDDPAFVANIEAEAVYQVKRLRHHASLALWCGNNELEQGVAVKGRENSTWPRMPWDEYAKVFDVLLADIVEKHDGVRAYWPSSPHTPYENRDNHGDERWGDVHHWAVWHGKKPFEWYRTTQPRFCSEFGFQSFPEPRTVETYAAAGDERNITSAVMEHHQRSGIGNTTIMQYMLSWFPMPNGSESVLWLSQIQQGLAIKYAVEHWRQHMDRCRGALYWQLNDNWPVASWASIDYYGRWKALQYMSKRFFAPLMVSGVEDPDGRKVDVHVSSDLAEDVACEVRWRVTSTAGEELTAGSTPVEVKRDASVEAVHVDCGDAIESAGMRRVLVWLELWRDGALVSHNLVSFVKPKHMGLESVSYATKIAKLGEGRFGVTVRPDKPSLWTWFALTDTDVRWSDNFACLAPEQDYTFEATTTDDLTVEEFKAQLSVRSIRDCF
jgi:beta-mannosidase